MNVPVLKTFVDMMYVQTLEVAVRRRHTLVSKTSKLSNSSLIVVVNVQVVAALILVNL